MLDGGGIQRTVGDAIRLEVITVTTQVKNGVVKVSRRAHGPVDRPGTCLLNDLGVRRLSGARVDVASQIVPIEQINSSLLARANQ